VRQSGKCWRERIMAVASFEDLCASFCELIQAPPPELSDDDQGRVAFHVIQHGITVNIVQCPQTSPDHVFVLFELGAVGQGAASFDQLRALLEANFVLEVHPPTFSRNPVTGDGVLQYVYPLFDATPNDLGELIDKGVEWVTDWQRSVAEDAIEQGGPAASGAASQPMLSFA